MNKDYIEIGGKKYRVEVNWNAIVGYCRMKGVTDLGGLDVLSKVDVADVPVLMYACCKEGERMDGRDFDMTPEDLGCVCGADEVRRFLSIYVEQSRTGGAERGKKRA